MAVSRRFLLCLAVAALLAHPAQARVLGVAGGVLGGERRPPVAAAFRHGLEGQDGGGRRWTRAPPRGGEEEAAELRMVPGGPDPLHHHGHSPRRPELEQPRLP